MGFVIGIRLSAAFPSPPDLIRLRASATATFSLPWKYLLAVSEDIAILTLGSQSTSSDHSQWRLPSSPSSAARMLTTRSRSVNSKRCGTSASRSFGPISGSVSIIEKTSSMTSTNSSSVVNSAFATQPAGVVLRDVAVRRAAGLRAGFGAAPAVPRALRPAGRGLERALDGTADGVDDVSRLAALLGGLLVLLRHGCASLRPVSG